MGTDQIAGHTDTVGVAMVPDIPSDEHWTHIVRDFCTEQPQNTENILNDLLEWRGDFQTLLSLVGLPGSFSVHRDWISSLFEHNVGQRWLIDVRLAEVVHPEGDDSIKFIKIGNVWAISTWVEEIIPGIKFQDEYDMAMVGTGAQRYVIGLEGLGLKMRYKDPQASSKSIEYYPSDNLVKPLFQFKKSRENLKQLIEDESSHYWFSHDHQNLDVNRRERYVLKFVENMGEYWTNDWEKLNAHWGEELGSVSQARISQLISSLLEKKYLVQVNKISGGTIHSDRKSRCVKVSSVARGIHRERERGIDHNNAYSRWREDEISYLIEQINLGTSVAHIANKLGRSEGSIRSRLKRIMVE